MWSKPLLLNARLKNAARLAALAAGLSLLGAGSAAKAQEPLTYEQRQEAAITAINKVLPAVVTIMTGSKNGSGVIIDGDKGYVLTNAHVVHGETYVTVTLLNGQKIDGSVARKNKELDLAIIRITVLEPLPEAPFGDSHEVKNADPVLAVGAPKGLASTVTMGTIIKSKTKFTFKDNSIDWMVVHDAPINPGNSGGPLVNLKGEIIGVNSMMVLRGGSSGGAPLYYAVSSHEIKSFASSFIPQRHTGRSGPQVSSKYLLAQPGDGDPAGHPGAASAGQALNFRKTRSVSRPLADYPPAALNQPRPQAAPLKPYLGLTLEALEMDSAVKAGLNPYMNFHRIIWLDPQGPAAQAGLMTGDILVRLNDRPIGSVADYEAILNNAVAGGATWAEIVRQGQSEMIPLTIGGRQQ